MIDVFDLLQFAPAFLKIRTKSGSIEPFVFNKAQLYIHKKLEQQRKETGKVRAVILKGRQQGCSTFIQARYFHKTITNRGIKTFILTHEAEATKNLFEMTKRYYEYLPPGLAPKAAKDSVKELRFDALDSGYAVGTAGNKGAGRSQTIQLCHCSEVGFYPHAEEHAQGLLQAIGTQSGTELVLESTANGIGNYFHSVWVGAEQGTNGFMPIFIPWYWQDEYTDDGHGFKPSEEDGTLFEQYKDNGLTMRHLAWRRKKIYEFHNDYDIGKIRFDQEYPMSAAIAFTNPIDDTFIHASHVMRARKAEVDSDASLIIGVDPAIGDNDRCAIIRRRGRKAYNIEVLRNHNTMELAGRLKTIIERERPHKVCVDCIGIGAGVTDRLQEMGFDCVEGVNVARSANDKERFANLRAELWSEMRDWLTGELPVDIPDDDELHRDLCGLGYKHKSNGQLLIESKIELKKRGFPSCDCFVAGTMVKTPQGDISIERLNEGDFVSTPYGKARVIKVWETVTEELTTLTLINGNELRSKPMHKVFTWDKGWVKIRDLTVSNLIETSSWINNMRWKLLNMSCTKVSSLEFKHQVDTIKQTTRLNRKDFYTDVFGWTTSVRFLKDTTSTIRMAIGGITRLITLNAFAAKSTCESTCWNGWPIQNLEKEPLRDKRKQSLPRRFGINQMKQKLFTRWQPKRDGLTESNIQQVNALSVKKNLSQFLLTEKGLGIAPENVALQTYIKNKRRFLKNVLGAIKSSWLTNIVTCNVAVKHVQTESVQPTKVYNLTLDTDNVYYANGVLVANCADALVLTFAYGQHAGTNSYTPNKMPDNWGGMFT